MDDDAFLDFIARLHGTLALGGPVVFEINGRVVSLTGESAQALHDVIEGAVARAREDTDALAAQTRAVIERLTIGPWEDENEWLPAAALAATQSLAAQPEDALPADAIQAMIAALRRVPTGEGQRDRRAVTARVSRVEGAWSIDVPQLGFGTQAHAIGDVLGMVVDAAALIGTPVAYNDIDVQVDLENTERAVGDLCTREQAAEIAGIAPSELPVMGTLDGDDPHPVLSFIDASNHPTVNVLIEILQAQAEDDFTVAWWLSSQLTVLGMRPVDWVHRGKDDFTIIRLAEQTAWAWSQ
ncbi:hypothetical protein [Demequina sp. NBRC 110054]|uniref:hypothetical protein n=1 Tax=Demequina sp. NBRC 110054 TaxID=1570343 RepID=UPI0009FF9DDF|nr:hypothetical protein [Demequina sp. NBRC 110054]